MSRTYTHILSTLILCSLPLQTVAAGILTVEDSVAGLGLEISLSGAPAAKQITFDITAPDGDAISVTATTDGNGAASATVPGHRTEKAGAYDVSATDNGKNAAPSVVANVLPESMDPWTSELQAWTPAIDPDGHDEADVTVTLRDRYGNPLAGRPVTLVAGRTDDIVIALTPETNADGVQFFSVKTETPGTIQLRAIDLLSGNTLISSAEIRAGSNAMGGHLASATQTNNDDRGRQMFYAQTTSFDIIDHFEVSAPSELPRGQEAQKITIRAVDRQGNTVEDYVGTVRFSSTDSEAQLPNFGSYTFKERDLGEKSFPLVLMFRSSGQQVFRVEDASEPGVSGEAEVNVSGGGGSAAGQISITSHQNDDSVNSTDIIIEGKGPRFANLIVMGGTADATGSTDENGAFSIPISLSETQRDFTIRVRDDAGRNDSGPIHLILDQVPPELKTITFAPENPETGEKVLVVVDSETGLAQVVLRMPDSDQSTVDEYKLTENPSQPGSYQAFFTAGEAGMYQPAVAAMDKAGNVEEVRTTFMVGAKSLPTVQNVKAEPRVNAVALQWDPVPGELSGYRVYVGDTPFDFLYTLDTGRVTTKATVAGLTAGKTYYFAVTALKDDLESEERSEPVEARVLGLTLDVKPENGALTVEWTSLSTDLPLSSFILEYGVEAEELTENRILNGELRMYRIPDLLNGITYYIRLTPITVTGDKLEELAANGQGEPNGSGFKPGARDDIPFNAATNPGDTLHPAPSTPGSGATSVVWMLAVTAGTLGVAYRWHRRRALKKSAAFLQAMQSQYRA